VNFEKTKLENNDVGSDGDEDDDTEKEFKFD
jgi:hypothetical protein